MSLYKQFKTDPSVERDGVILDYGDGVKIRIARAGGVNNKAFLRAIEAFARKHRRQIQLDTLPEDVSRQILREVVATTVVLGWEGVTDEAGNSLPFTKENAIKLFEDLPDLFSDLYAQAQNAALFREDVREADAKN